MKLCKDCKHFQWGGSGSCVKTAEGVSINLVYGTEYYKSVKLAQHTRHDEGLCGVKARWFEKKEED